MEAGSTGEGASIPDGPSGNLQVYVPVRAYAPAAVCTVGTAWRPGRVMLVNGASATFLGRTATGMYAFAIPAADRTAGSRPLVLFISPAEMPNAAGRARPWARPFADRRGDWSRT